MTSRDPQSEIVHASCVAVANAGVLILGPAGAGKSALTLQLMALGAVLVADDRTQLRNAGDGLIARCPRGIRGQIEARGVGILAADTQAAAIVRLAVDLATPETDRLPPFRTVTLLGHEIALLHSTVHSHFPAAILQYLKAGRRG